MKKKHTLIIICVLFVGIFSTAAVLADSHRKDYRKDFGFKQHHKGAGLQLLARYQQKNMKIQVLSEMAGQSAEAIGLKLKDQRMRSLMRELNLDRRAFRLAMQAKVREQISRAAADGSITAEQEKEILGILETRAKRAELMNKLVEKGLEDGTITAAEARMLRPKRR
jgi:hypothetical protein